MKYKILQGDCLQLMQAISYCDTIFADPPDNIGLSYDTYEDRRDAQEYVQFLDHLIVSCLQQAKTSYISFNARWMTPVGHTLREVLRDWPDVDIRWLIQGYTFGQHNKHDLANNFRPIIRLRQSRDVPLFPDAVRVESERMKIGDKRANPAGRVPGDVWFSDFLQYSRVVGNSKQRRAWHPTQLHEGLVEDCLLMSTPPGGTVIDPFAGTGTTMRVCRANGWSCTTMDVDAGYCERIAEENGIPYVSKGIWFLTTEES